MAATQGHRSRPAFPRHRQRGDAQARGLERMGAVGRPCGVGQAAARQRSASRLTFPGIWYLARLVGPGFDIRGATSPGSPAIVLGHNGTIGWGFTTTNLDSQDLFVERVDPTDPQPLHHARRRPPLRRARGDDQGRCGAIPVAMRCARRGTVPVIDDFVARRDDPANLTRQAMCWPCRPPRSTAPTPRRGLCPRSARRRTGTNSSNGGPQDRLADAEHGLCRHRRNIGLISPARVPIRRKGDGSMPVPGWTGRVRLGGLRAVRRAAPRLQSGQRRDRQRQRPRGAHRLPPLHQPGLGRALSPAPRRPDAG